MAGSHHIFGVPLGRRLRRAVEEVGRAAEEDEFGGLGFMLSHISSFTINVVTLFATLNSMPSHVSQVSQLNDNVVTLFVSFTTLESMLSHMSNFRINVATPFTTLESMLSHFSEISQL